MIKKEHLFSGLLLLATPALAIADAETDKGKAVFNGAGACFTCHGTSGKGDGPAAASLNPKPASFLDAAAFKFDTDGDGKKGTEKDIFDVITNGAAKYGGSVLMAPQAHLSEADRKALAKYVVSFR